MMRTTLSFFHHVTRSCSNVNLKPTKLSDISVAYLTSRGLSQSSPICPAYHGRLFLFTKNIPVLEQRALYSRTCNQRSRTFLSMIFQPMSLIARQNIHLSKQSSRAFNQSGSVSKTDVVLYVLSGIIFMVGVAYASVPLYRMFCQATGIGGDPTLGHKIDNVASMKPIRERPITVIFNADRHAAMQWNFKPSQPRVKVVPGETALAFYTAKNPTDEPIVGVATYNVLPFQAGPYFNKIQCFCFEEQWLNPHEEVDMPVFFYIDPEFDNDPLLAVVDEIVLSYTFFKADSGDILPMPGFMNTKFKGVQKTESQNLA